MGRAAIEQRACLLGEGVRLGGVARQPFRGAAQEQGGGESGFSAGVLASRSRRSASARPLVPAGGSGGLAVKGVDVAALVAAARFRAGEQRSELLLRALRKPVEIPFDLQRLGIGRIRRRAAPPRRRKPRQGRSRRAPQAGRPTRADATRRPAARRAQHSHGGHICRSARCDGARNAECAGGGGHYRQGDCVRASAVAAPPIADLAKECANRHDKATGGSKQYACPCRSQLRQRHVALRDAAAPIEPQRKKAACARRKRAPEGALVRRERVRPWP